MDNSTGYTIRTAASRTGLSEHVLRVWERRHNAVCPRRDDNGRRIYSDADLQRLLMLSRLVEKGQSIGRIADLDEQQLQQQLSALEAGGPEGTAQTDVTAHQQVQEALLKSVLESAKRYDIEACCTALAAAVIGMNVDDLMKSVCSPIMQAIGDEWQAGRLNEAQEHIIGIAFTSFFLPRITSSLNRARASGHFRHFSRRTAPDGIVVSGFHGSDTEYSLFLPWLQSSGTIHCASGQSRKCVSCLYQRRQEGLTETISGPASKSPGDDRQ